MIISDTPDGCKSIAWYKHATAARFDDTPNVFYDEHSFCAAHTLHNCIAGASGEVHLVGNVHAVSVVMHVEHRVRQLLDALRHLVDPALQVFAGPAHQEHVEHTQAVLQTTVMRARAMIRARAGSDGSLLCSFGHWQICSTGTSAVQLCSTIAQDVARATMVLPLVTGRSKTWWLP